jgi:hypothetical protein
MSCDLSVTPEIPAGFLAIPGIDAESMSLAAGTGRIAFWRLGLTLSKNEATSAGLVRLSSPGGMRCLS